MVELTSCHIHWHTDCTLPVSQLQLRDLVLKPVYIWGAVRRLVNQGSWSVSVPTRRALRAGRGRAMSRRQVSLVEGTVVNDWLSSILRRLNNNVSCPRPLAPSRGHWLPKRHCNPAVLPRPRQLPHRTASYGANQEKAVAEARQGLVELGAFSFVPVLEGLMRMIENLQEVRAVPSAVTHMHAGHPPTHP